MIRIAFLLLYCILGLYGYSDNRNILIYSIQNGIIKASQDKSDAPNLHVYFNNKEFAVYTNDGGIPSLKLIHYDDKKKLLILLVGTAIKHRALGIDATAYELDFFSVANVLPTKINLLSQEGYEGNLEDGSATFKYKNIAEIITNLNNLTNYLVQFSKSEPKQYNKINIDQVLNTLFLDDNTLEDYNNIAYYLEKSKMYKESAYLLEKIIEKFPDRTVAYFNLGDAYYGLRQKDKAIKTYQTYIDQMKKKGWENKIPKRVLDRVKEAQ